MVSSLPGQSVGLWGQPSHVASCGSHSAGIAYPNSMGVGSDVERGFSIRSGAEDKVFGRVVHGDLANRWLLTGPTSVLCRSTKFGFELWPELKERTSVP